MSIWRSGLGFASLSYMAIGTDAVDELEHLCRLWRANFPKSTFFAGPARLSARHLVPATVAQPNGLFAAAPLAMGRRADGYSARHAPVAAGCFIALAATLSALPIRPLQHHKRGASSQRARCEGAQKRRSLPLLVGATTAKLSS